MIDISPAGNSSFVSHSSCRAKSAMPFCLLLLALLMLSGCESVYTRQPMGEEVVQLDEATWQGTWLSDQVVLLTTVLDAEKGLLQAAWMERYAEGARFETFTGSVRRTGGWMFLVMKHEESKGDDIAEAAEEMAGENDPAEPEYFWARVDNDGRRTILWWPDVEQIRLAVIDERLPGIIKEDNDVTLGQLEAEHLQMINTPASGLLRWSEPVVFVRIGD